MDGFTAFAEMLTHPDASTSYDNEATDRNKTGLRPAVEDSPNPARRRGR